MIARPDLRADKSCSLTYQNSYMSASMFSTRYRGSTGRSGETTALGSRCEGLYRALAGWKASERRWRSPAA